MRGIDFVTFSDQDVVRHDLVGRIVKAYDRYLEQQEYHEKKKAAAIAARHKQDDANNQATEEDLSK